MPRLLPSSFAIVILALGISACGNYSLPTAEEQAKARRALSATFQPVSLASRSDGRAVSLRWQIGEPEFTDARWHWREVEVVAEAAGDGEEAVRFVRQVRLNPEMLAKNVPAAFTRETWALSLICAEGNCIEIDELREVYRGGELVAAEEEVRRTDRHDLLFQDYEPRDRAIVLARRAIGAPPR